MTEPLACAVQGADDCRLQAGQRVLVIGSGPIGLMFARLAGSMGCLVCLAGRGAHRLELAKRLGAAETLEVGREPGALESLCHRLGDSFDVVFEAVGKTETWEAAVLLARKGGLVNFFGGCPAGTQIRLDTSRLHYSSLALVASFHHTPQTIRRALELIETGVIRSEDFVDGACRLSRLPEWFRAALTANPSVKTLVNVDQ